VSGPEPTAAALVLVGLAVLAGLAAFGVVSLRERERRAAAVAFALAVAGGILFFVAAAQPPPVRIGVLAGLGATAVVCVALWYLPIGPERVGNGRPTRRVDERDIMFARARLRPGTPQFEAYYAMRPGNREGDDRTRALPGLLSPDAAKAEPVAFASARDSFDEIEALREKVDGPVAPARCDETAARSTARLRQLALDLGARDFGVTPLRPYHVYTHVGRGSGVWGEPIVLEHRWAIALTVEMDHATMRCAPEAPVVAESALRYVESARIAVRLAATIRSLGWPARAHICREYRVIAPLVARDAGLGEIGRMGILMTPRLGPRVRIAVVTTDLPLVPDHPTDDRSVIDFCVICEKCAVNCPSASIPFGGRERIDGGWRWAIDPDTCFRYWAATGADCGRCMTVCPYSHPDNAAHRLVRGAIRRSAAARRAALWLDDLFYGRRPRAAGPTSVPVPAPLRREIRRKG
jgi:reductive dehalogenase